jgi:hypothetical protein
MEGDLQRGNTRSDDEVAYFPGTPDQRSFEDYKRLKLWSREVSVGADTND